jgi:hypothetical protein
VLVALTLVVIASACMPPLVEPSTSGRDFGEGPLDAIHTAAELRADCGLTPIQLTAMMMAPTYTEAGGPVPSPMALSRWDNLSVSSTNANLFAFGQTSGPYVDAFFSPGIGLWQFDSAGAWPFSAAGAIDSENAARQAATTMTYRWCNAPESKQTTPQARRKYAWGPWYGCSTTNVCEDIYTSLVAGDRLDTAFDASVTRFGGMQQRSCNVAGLGDGLTCWYVNPTLAEGSRGWTGGTYTGGPGGVTPLPKPFYIVERDGREHRIWIRADTGYDTGITASKPITANARTSLTWTRTADLCDVTANRGQCQGRVAQTPWGPKSGNPFGNLDAVSASADGRVTAAGWAIDPDTNDAVDVHVYVDGRWTLATKADVSRPDVGAMVAGYGDQHGFRAGTGPLAPGDHQVCAFGINVGPGGDTNPQLGCLVVSVPSEPFGSTDVVSPAVAGARVVGWAIDPDQPTTSVTVRFTVDGAPAGSATASVERGDVGVAYPAAGARHGFDAVVPTTGGSHTVCAEAVNVGPGEAARPLGCGAVTVDGSPIGNGESVTSAPGGVRVGGWGFDPDTGDATVRIAVDGVVVTEAATTVERPDVAAAFPGRGSAHGFDVVVPAGAGRHTVCVTLVDQGSTGRDASLGCAAVDTWSGNPVGNLESVVRTAGSAQITGWALDPDTADPVAVHVYVDGVWGGATTASRSRPDVGAAYPGYGEAHGISAQVAVPAGAANVCVYLINAGAGTANPLLGCRRV